jgi:hypothetical protein
MNEGTATLSEIGRAALGHLVAKRGHLSETSADAWVSSQSDPRAAREALARAAQHFAAGDRQLFLCRGEACRPAPDSADAAARAGVLSCDTGCQGECERGPMATLLFDGAARSFGGLDTREAWRDLNAYIARCVAAGSALVEDGAAKALRFDPDHPETGPDLAPFAFLHGHFRGEGVYGTSGRSFRKEVIGRWEAGGAALSLRMEVAYPLPSGGVDAHEALVLVTPERDGEFWIGRAITDGGVTQAFRYAFDADSGALHFSDRPPGHGHSAKRARKLLIPAADGYEERLEVERDGGFETYSSILLTRVKEGTPDA